jgi:hypothetical protein
MQVSASSSATAPQATSQTTTASDASAAAWGTTAVQQAVATISDTTGKYTQDQQLAAYNQIANLVTGSGVGGADRTAAVQAWEGSAIYQQVAQAQDTYTQNYMVPDGTSGSAAVQGQISSFNNLASSQQQIIVNQINNSALNGPYATGKTAFASVSSFQTYQQTQLGVQQALEGAFSSGTLTNASLNDPSTIKDPKLAALVQVATQNGMSDAWTSQAQAALSAYQGSQSSTSSSAPVVKVTLSDEAKSTLSASAKTVAASTATGADIGLALLTDASTKSAKAAETANVENASTTQAHAASKPYTQGQVLNTTI